MKLACPKTVTWVKCAHRELEAFNYVYFALFVTNENLTEKSLGV